MKKILPILLFALFFTGTYAIKIVNAQTTTAEEYIQKYKGIAISEMEKHGIPASIKLAQGLLESGMGNSRLAVYGNNHFGIKCHTTWDGPSMKHTDDAKDECFRVYSDPFDSYRDHSQFLLTRSRYNDLFKLKSDDYKGWAYGLKAAGYATNPKYAEMLIDVIERHQLYVYDMQELSMDEKERYRNKLIGQEKETLIALHKQNATIDATQPSVVLPASPTANIPTAHTGVVFYNNRVKVVRMQKDETLKDISKKYGISVNRLNSYNDLAANQSLTEGQLVYLEPKRKKAKEKKHLVLSHESLWSISQMYGVQLSRILERNYLKKGEEPVTGVTINLNKKADKKPQLRDKNEIAPSKVTVPIVNSEQIVIPAKPAPQYPPTNHTVPIQGATINYHPFNFPITETSSANSNFIYHTVQTGDTLYNISKRYQVDVEQLKIWNSMTDNNIQLGQNLIIYQ